MKKGFVITFFCLFLTGCSTISTLFENIFSFGEDKNSNSSYLENKNGTKISKNPSLPVPESYEVAYSYRTSKPDERIVKLIKDRKVESLRVNQTNEYIKIVTTEIINNSTNDFEKAKFVYDFVAVLVHYDAASFWSGKLPSQDWETVIKTKNGVCEGYANVFKKVCDLVQLPCKVVHGYARGVGTDITTESLKAESNHAWNIVQIEKKWYLIDSTWGAGYMNGKKSVQSYNTDWLFTKPQHFIATHYPEKAINQLLQTPLLEKEFFELADFRPIFYEITGEDISKIKKNNIVENRFVFSYSNDDYRFTFNVRDLAKSVVVKNCCLSEKTENGTKVNIDFPRAGVYSIDVFYWKKGSKRGSSCGKFLVEATKPSDIKYPDILLTTKNATLIEPLTMPLIRGNSYDFVVDAVDYNFVFVNIDRQFIKLEKQDDGRYKGYVEIPKTAKKVNICVSNKERGSYEILTSYILK